MPVAWEWALERLVGAHNYWLATASTERGPYVRPVWAIWCEEGLLFTAGRRSRKMRNLELDPRASIHAELVREVVVVDGVVGEVEPTPAQLDAYRAKYAWLPPETHGWYLLRAEQVYAADETLPPDEAAHFKLLGL